MEYQWRKHCTWCGKKITNRKERKREEFKNSSRFFELPFIFLIKI